MAGPESRRAGSSRMSASAPIAASCSATKKRYWALVTTTGRPNKAGSDTRRIVSWNVDSGPNSGRNCFGRFSREAGQSRVPAPPHMMRGTIGCANLRSRYLAPAGAMFANQVRCVRSKVDCRLCTDDPRGPVQVSQQSAAVKWRKRAAQIDRKIDGPSADYASNKEMSVVLRLRSRALVNNDCACRSVRQR